MYMILSSIWMIAGDIWNFLTIRQSNPKSLSVLPLFHLRRMIFLESIVLNCRITWGWLPFSLLWLSLGGAQVFETKANWKWFRKFGFYDGRLSCSRSSSFNNSSYKTFQNFSQHVFQVVNSQIVVRIKIIMYVFHYHYYLKLAD